MHKITCQNASGAAVLTTILEAEGHATVWFRCSHKTYSIATNAPLSAITTAIDSANTITRAGVR